MCLKLISTHFLLLFNIEIESHFGRNSLGHPLLIRYNSGIFIWFCGGPTYTNWIKKLSWPTWVRAWSKAYHHLNISCCTSPVNISRYCKYSDSQYWEGKGWISTLFKMIWIDLDMMHINQKQKQNKLELSWIRTDMRKDLSRQAVIVDILRIFWI